MPLLLFVSLWVFILYLSFFIFSLYPIIPSLKLSFTFKIILSNTKNHEDYFPWWTVSNWDVTLVRWVWAQPLHPPSYHGNLHYFHKLYFYMQYKNDEFSCQFIFAQDCKFHIYPNLEQMVVWIYTLDICFSSWSKDSTLMAFFLVFHLLISNNIDTIRLVNCYLNLPIFKNSTWAAFPFLELW